MKKLLRTIKEEIFTSSLSDKIKELKTPLLIVLGAALMSRALLSFEFSRLEGWLYDFRIKNTMAPTAEKQIALVAFDAKTTEYYNDFFPLPLNFHNKLIQKLESAHPMAIGYLIDMNQVKQLDPKLFENDELQNFIATGKRLQNKGIPFLFGTDFNINGEIIPPLSLNDLPHSIALIHKDGNIFAGDNVTRRALISMNGKPTFHLKLAESLRLKDPNTEIRGAYTTPEISAKYFFFRYHGDTSLNESDALLNSNGSYPVYSAVDILENRISRKELENKIILVGTLNRESSKDFTLTPYSKKSFTHYKLIVHANILDSIINNQGILPLPASINWAITFLLISLVLWWVLTSTPLNGVVATLSLAVLFVGISHLLFQVQGAWILESQPLIGIFLTYYLVVPYRLIREYKKRWEFQRENELFHQVEELKNNFLSLVTHDLKTPVARIQGLAEVLLRKATDRLLDRDKQTLTNIIDSTEELNHFITRILELSKIESNRMSINLEFKDINQLIERIVKNFKAQARARHSKISTKLEPLFPIKIDPVLIGKVINNLIDNALKYSPKGSNIFVESKEVNNFIQISIKDPGIGMNQEELEKLFTRFYRAKNDTTTKVSGTGLGLYLTKYFIEAHHGSVEVHSKAGEGSNFTITLPLDGPGKNLAPKAQAKKENIDSTPQFVKENFAKVLPFKFKKQIKKEIKDV